MKRPEYFEENGCLHVQFRGSSLTEEKNETNENMPLTDFMQQWLHMMKSQVRANTLDGYWYMFHKHIEPYYRARQVTLSSAKPAHFQEFVNLKYEEGYSPTSIVKFHSIVHKCLRYAVTMQLIEHNPSDHVLLPKRTRYIGKVYDQNQLNRFLREAKNSAGQNRHLCLRLPMACAAVKLPACAGVPWISKRVPLRSIILRFPTAAVSSTATR